jgi:multidrug efflux system membrane fusion protein
MSTRQDFSRILLLGVVVFGLAACGPAAEEEPAAAALQVSLMTLEAHPLTVSEDLPGRVAAFRSAEVRAQIGGIVHRRRFEQGSEVKAGSVLFQINPAPFAAEVDSAAAALQRTEVTLTRATIQVDRLAPLMQAEAVSRQAYDDAVALRDQAAAELAQAKATLARRRLDLQFASVEAPISGRIDQALVSEGALVAPGDSSPMARIQQIDQVYVDVRQSAAALDSLRRQAGAAALAADILDGEGKPMELSGRILFSGIEVDAGTGEVLLRILVDNPQRRLLPGMYVRARIARAHYPAALSVPQQAVQRRGNQASVWVVDARGRAQPRAIELGELLGRRYRVVSGLSAGEQVAIEGIERLSPDAPVVTRAWQPAAAGH